MHDVARARYELQEKELELPPRRRDAADAARVMRQTVPPTHHIIKQWNASPLQCEETVTACPRVSSGSHHVSCEICSAEESTLRGHTITMARDERAKTSSSRGWKEA
jgi:hypothetical protein